METPSLVALPISGNIPSDDIPDSVVGKIIDQLPHSEERELVLQISRFPLYTQTSENGLTPRNAYDARIAWAVDFNEPYVSFHNQPDIRPYTHGNMGKLLGIHAVDESMHPPGCGLDHQFCMWRQWFIANARLALQPILSRDNLRLGLFNITRRPYSRNLVNAVLFGHNWDEAATLRGFVAQLVQRMNASSSRAGKHPGFSLVTHPAGETSWWEHEDNAISRTEYHRVFYIPKSRSREAVRATSHRGYELSSTG